MVIVVPLTQLLAEALGLPLPRQTCDLDLDQRHHGRRRTYAHVYYAERSFQFDGSGGVLVFKLSTA